MINLRYIREIYTLRIKDKIIKYLHLVNCLKTGYNRNKKINKISKLMQIRTKLSDSEQFSIFLSLNTLDNIPKYVVERNDCIFSVKSFNNYIDAKNYIGN